MLAKQQQVFGMKLIASVFCFLYLHLLLWSTFLRPAIDIDEQWVPMSFFFPSKQSTCFISIQHTPTLAIFESMFFAIIALVGYYHAITGLGNSVRISSLTLANFELAMMGVQQKYYWMCFVPWIITFGHNWLQNVGAFLLLFSNGGLYEANDFMPSMIILMLFFSVQAMLASEVVYMALQGWYAMKIINDEDILWEQRKSILLGTRI